MCRWLDSNRGPLVSEATALPTEIQPLAFWNLFMTSIPAKLAQKFKLMSPENLLRNFLSFFVGIWNDILLRKTLWSGDTVLMTSCVRATYKEPWSEAQFVLTMELRIVDLSSDLPLMTTEGKKVGKWNRYFWFKWLFFVSRKFFSSI